MAKVVDSVDNRLGLLAYDNLFWQRTLKDLGMLSTRALGWNVGTIGRSAVARWIGEGPHRCAQWPDAGGDRAHGLCDGAAICDRALWLDGPLPANGPAVRKQRRTASIPAPRATLDLARLPERRREPGSTTRLVPRGTRHRRCCIARSRCSATRTSTGTKSCSRSPGDTAGQAMVRAAEQAFGYVGRQFVPFTGRNVWQSLQQGDVPQAVAGFFGLNRAPYRMQRRGGRGSVAGWEEKKRQLPAGAVTPDHTK